MNPHRRCLIVLALAGLHVCLSLAQVASVSAQSASARSSPKAAEPGLGRAGDRIVSVGGAVTEILHRLGIDDRIVAVDTTSVYPEQVRSKPSVGYMRALSAEGILALRPSAVVAVEGAGPPAVLDLIRSAGVPLLMVPDRSSPDGIPDKIKAIGEVTGQSFAAGVLAQEVATGIDDLRREIATDAQPVRALFVLTLQNGRPLVAGRETAADGVLTLAGAVNAAASFSGYKPMTDEALIAAAPEAIVMMNRPGATPTATGLFANPAFAQTPAAAKASLVVMDGNYLLGLGPRTPQAARDLMKALRDATGRGSGGRPAAVGQ